MSVALTPDPSHLKKLAAVRMPYGKYAGRLLINLPEPYVVWMVGNSLPDGLLGRQLLEVYELKVNGLETLLRPFAPQDGND